jgi:hypothetical protein
LLRLTYALALNSQAQQWLDRHVTTYITVLKKIAREKYAALRLAPTSSNYR